MTSLERKKGRVGFSIRQMTDDPLLETLDTLMAPEVSLSSLDASGSELCLCLRTAAFSAGGLLALFVCSQARLPPGFRLAGRTA